MGLKTRFRQNLVRKWHQAGQEKKRKSEWDTYLAVTTAQDSKGGYPARSPGQIGRAGGEYVVRGNGHDERRVGHEQQEGEKTRGRKEERKKKL